MQTTHTPGPWSVSPPCELSPRYSVYHNGPLVYCDRAEDAALIAAAPDLLAVLLIAEAALAAYSGGESSDLDAIRAAIAKATGGAA